MICSINLHFFYDRRGQAVSENTRSWPSVGSLLGQCRRRWANIGLTSRVCCDMYNYILRLADMINGPRERMNKMNGKICHLSEHLDPADPCDPLAEWLASVCGHWPAIPPTLHGYFELHSPRWPWRPGWSTCRLQDSRRWCSSCKARTLCAHDYEILKTWM